MVEIYGDTTGCRVMDQTFFRRPERGREVSGYARLNDSGFLFVLLSRHNFSNIYINGRLYLERKLPYALVTVLIRFALPEAMRNSGGGATSRLGATTCKRSFSCLKRNSVSLGGTT